MAEFPANVMSHIYMRTDKPPLNDVRVRRAISHAIDRQGILDATAEGVGIMNPTVPAALKEWALPINQLGEGARYYKYDVREAKKLLAEAGHPNGFPATIDFTTYGSTVLVDAMQLILKYLKDVGIDAKLNTKEYGAYITTTFYGKFDSMAYGPQTPFLEPDNFLYPYNVEGGAQEPEPREGSGGHGPAGTPAAHDGHRQASGDHPRDPAPPGQAAVLRPDAVGRVRRGVGPSPQELRAQPGL